MITIPYEKQQDKHSCGPAALAMVYRSLGRAVQQAEIWPLVGRQQGGGRWSSRTHALCQDALRRGLAALIIQAALPPWPLLEQCQRGSLRCILNHRLNVNTTQRHFSVLLEAGNDQVVRHDPLEGPELRLEREAFLQLWSARRGQAGGHVLIALAEPSTAATTCAICGQEMPATAMCRACLQPVRLDPAAALGCLKAECSGGWWQTVYCTHCDAALHHADLREKGE